MKDKIFIIFLVIVIIFIGWMVKKTFIDPDNTKIDTVFVQTIRYDTLFRTDTVFQTARVTKYFPVEVEVAVVPDSLLYLLNDNLGKVRIYNRQYLVNNTIVNVHTKALGHMYFQEVKVADLNPIIVKTITNDRTVTIKKPQSGVFVGIHALKGIGVQAHFQFKSGWQVGYQYTIINEQGGSFITLSKKVL